MSDDCTIAMVDKNSAERLVIRLTNYKGFNLLDVRTEWKNKAGEYRPTRKGLALSGDQWRSLLGSIENGVQALELEASIRAADQGATDGV